MLSERNKLKYDQEVDVIDYRDDAGQRKRMVNYLQTGGFKKVVGAPILSRIISRRRRLVSTTAMVILFIGLYYVLKN